MVVSGKLTEANAAMQIAIGGALNVLRQAVKMNVKKIVVTSSWGATVDCTANLYLEANC